MYRHFPPISDTCITADSKMGLGGRSLGQIVGFYYFVLNHSKRFRGGNTALLDGVKMVCGTPVVHFAALWYTKKRVPQSRKKQCITL